MKRLANQLTSHERKLRALDLRKAGATYQMIADQLGYGGPSGAYKAVTSALKATLKEPADELRTMELERLDAMLLPLWRRVQNGDERAVDRVLRIMERRAKLLGLDAPTKVDLAVQGLVEALTGIDDGAPLFPTDPEAPAPAATG